MKTSQEQIDRLKRQIENLEEELARNKNLVEEVARVENVPLYDIYSWEAPDRIYTSQGKNWYLLVSIIAIITIFFALLTENYMLILTILAVIFLIYAMNTVPPRIIQYAITNKGVRVKEDLFLWNDIASFWITERKDELLINIELKEYKGRIIALVGEGDVNKILTELTKHEDYREPKGLEAMIGRLTEGRYKKLTEFSS